MRAIATSLLAVAPAWAATTVAPSASVAEVYDDNVGATAEPRGAFLTRAGGALDVGFRPASWTAVGHVALAVERIEGESAGVGRRLGGVDLSARATPAVTLEARGAYLETHTPSELAGPTGLELGRREWARATAGAGVMARFDRRTGGSAAYAFARDKLAGFVSTSHVGTLAIDRRLGRRDTVDGDAQLRSFSFTGGGPARSAVVLAGWTHLVAPAWSLTLRAGPRLSPAIDGVEGLAAIAYTGPRAHLAASYAHSRATIVGAQGVVDTDSAFATAAWRPRECPSLSATPGATRVYGAADVTLWRVEVDAACRAGRWVTLLGSYRWSEQHALGTTAASGDVARGVALVAITIADFDEAPPAPGALP